MAVIYRLLLGSVKDVKIKDATIKNWDNNNQLLLWPSLFKIGKLKLSTSGDHKYLKAYANPAQLNHVTVLLLIPALTNQTDRVENTNKIGKPDEKPKQSIFKGFSWKNINIFFFN